MFLILHAMFCHLSNFTELKACVGLFRKMLVAGEISETFIL
jgi:hypothetical protein